MSNTAAEGRKRKFHDEPDADDAEKVNSAKNRAQAILAAKLAKTSANPPLPEESAPPLPPGDAGAPPPPPPDDSFVPPLPPTSANNHFAPALPEEEAPPLPAGMHPSQLQDFMPKYHIPKSSLDDKDMEDLKVYGKNFVKDVNLNENRNRYQITPEETRKSLEKEFGVKLELIGKYFPDRRLADRHPPMFLRVTAPSREKMKQVLSKIKQLLERKLNLIDDGFKRKYFEDKVPIGIDASPSFNLRGKLVGQNGVFVKHIQQSADCRIQIKGRGSQYKEDDGREADEPMFFFLSAKTDDALSRAKDLCKDLIKTVREQYKQWKDRTAMESLQSQYAVSAVDQGAEYYAQQYAQQQQQGDGQGYDYSMYYQQLQQQQQQEQQQQPVYDYTAGPPTGS